MREDGRSLTRVVALTAVVAVGISVAAVAQDATSAAKRTRRPRQVDVVQSVPVDVASLPPVEVSNLPAVDVASLPGVAVTSLPSVEVAALPAVHVAALPDVAVSALPPVQIASMPSVAVSSLPPVAVASLPAVAVASMPPVTISSGPSNAVVTLAGLDGAKLTAETTSAEIDCDGYRAVSVFVGHEAVPVGHGFASVQLRVEFFCNGIWATPQGTGTYSLGESDPLLASIDALGTKLRLRFEKSGPEGLSFPPIDDVTVGVYLRR